MSFEPRLTGAQFYNASAWGKKFNHIKHLSEVNLVYQALGGCNNEMNITEEDMIQPNLNKTSFFSKLITLIIEALTFLEKKNLRAFDLKHHQINEIMEKLIFLKKSMTEISFHLLRREEGNVYIKYHQYYSELLKFVYIIDKKLN